MIIINNNNNIIMQLKLIVRIAELELIKYVGLKKKLLKNAKIAS